MVKSSSSKIAYVLKVYSIMWSYMKQLAPTVKGASATVYNYISCWTRNYCLCFATVTDLEIVFLVLHLIHDSILSSIFRLQQAVVPARLPLVIATSLTHRVMLPLSHLVALENHLQPHEARAPAGRVAHRDPSNHLAMVLIWLFLFCTNSDFMSVY